MRPYARLDAKTGLRVLCGAQVDGRFVCGAELARVGVLPDGRRVLCMLDGWKHRARGHWALSNHSRRQLAAGERPRFRRRKETGRNYQGDPFQAAFPSLGPKDNYVVQPWPSGSLADCPKCQAVNVLTAEHLRVLPA